MLDIALDVAQVIGNIILIGLILRIKKELEEE